MKKIVNKKMDNYEDVNWVSNFEEKFKIQSINDNSFKIIIGEAPYKQRLGKTPLKQYCISNFYNNFYYVSFVVNQWIKITDSLEAIFNLLFQDSVLSIRAIVYLKANNISAKDFALYLLEKHKILLINRYLDSKKKNKKFNGMKDRKQYLLNLLNLLTSNNTNNIVIKILFVGKESLKDLNLNFNNVFFGEVIHPSSNNIGKSGYFEIWYNFDDNYINNKKGNINLKDFSIR